MGMRLDYDRWRTDHGETLGGLRGREVILSFSGGRDCSLLLAYLLRAREEFGFSFRVVGARYPNHCFPDDEVREIAGYWRDRGIEVEFHEIEEDDRECDEAAGRGENPCKVCHAKREAYLKRFLRERTSPLPLVVVFGFTLWDLVSYSIEYLLGHLYAAPSSPSVFQGEYAGRRFREGTARRFFPLYRTVEGYRVFQPLVLYNDPEIYDALGAEGTRFLDVPCRYARLRPKRMLAEVFGPMGLLFDHGKVLAFARNAIGLEGNLPAEPAGGAEGEKGA